VPAEFRNTIDARMQLFLRKKFAQYADSGLLLNDKLLCVLREAGLNPLDVRCLDLVSEFDMDGDGVVSFTEFVHMYCRLKQEEEEVSNVVNFFEKAFKFFDRDGDLRIDCSEFQEAMRGLGDALTEEEVKSFIAALDKDDDGCIGLTEFTEFLQTDRRSTHLMLEAELEREDLEVFQPEAAERDSLQFEAVIGGLLARLSRKFSGISSATAAAAVESDCCCCACCCEPGEDNRVRRAREGGRRGHATPSEADAKYTVSFAKYPGHADAKPVVAPPALAKSMDRAGPRAEPDDTSDEILNHVSLTHHPTTCQRSPHEAEVREDLPGLNGDQDEESRQSSGGYAESFSRARTSPAPRTRIQEQLPQENGVRSASHSHHQLQQHQQPRQEHRQELAIQRISSPGEIHVDRELKSGSQAPADATPDDAGKEAATSIAKGVVSNLTLQSENSASMRDKQLMEAYLPEGTLVSPDSRSSTPTTLDTRAEF